MDLRINNCAIVTAIITVLIFLLLQNLVARFHPEAKGKDIDSNPHTWASTEILMLISVYLAYNFHHHIFSSCST